MCDWVVFGQFVFLAGSVHPSPKTKERDPMSANPYDRLPATSSFQVTSGDLEDGGPLGIAQYSAMTGIPGATDTSPQLSWSGFPEGTKSFAITMYDADAPTPSGFWHWAVANIPAEVTELAAGAGGGGGLPDGALLVPNDVRAPIYVGAMPPQGSGKHRYFIAVHALDVANITEAGFDAQGTPAGLNFTMLGHTLGRAIITPWGGEA